MGIKFAAPAELAAWLERIGIDIQAWGKGSYKSIANLWDEYQAGEVYFEDGPPMRVVQVVQLLVQQDDAFLVEVEQQLNNGKRRFRNQPPAEKIKSGETLVNAAYRCLEEELGLGKAQIEEINVVSERDELLAGSPSYPGLPTRYRIYEVKARVNGLPDQDFWRENVAASEGDPVSRHLWGWRKQD